MVDKIESRRKVLRTTNVSNLRADLSLFLKNLDEGPVLILSHSQPVAMLVDPEMYEGLLEKIEMLEDIIDGRRALADYHANPEQVVDAEEAFRRLGY